MDTIIEYQLRPTLAQQKLIIANIKAYRYIYNYFLKKHISRFSTIKFFSVSEYAKEVTQLRKEYPELKTMDSVALQQAVRELQRDYVAYFRKEATFPKFRNHNDDLWFYRTGNNHDTIRIEDGKIRLPKIGWVKIGQGEPLTGRIVCAEIHREEIGFSISLYCVTDGRKMTGLPKSYRKREQKTA